MTKSRLWRAGLTALALCLMSGGYVVSAQKQAPLAEAERLDRQVAQFSQTGQYDKAIPLAERSLALKEKALGPAHLTLAADLNGLALLYQYQSNYEKALTLFQRALGIYERVLGPEHPDVATTLNNLGLLYLDRGEPTAALPYFQRALAIREQKLGPEHPDVADSLTGLAFACQAQADYERALQLLQRARDIRAKKFDANDVRIAHALRNIALLYYEQGDFFQALPSFLQALAIYEKAAGPDSALVAANLNDVALTYQQQGDYPKALPLLQRALAIREKAAGPDNPELARALNNLGGWYHDQGDSAHALPLFQRALALREQALGAWHPDTANSLNNIASVYSSQGDYQKALPLSERALAIREKVFGHTHPAVAVSLTNLAELHYRLGNAPKAAELFQDALDIFTKTLGGASSYVALLLDNLAILAQAQGDYARAVSYKQQAAEVGEKSLSAILAAGSQQQKQLYLDKLAYETSGAVSLHLHDAPNNADAARLALTTILRRKGRALDAFTSQLALLRQRATPADRALLEQLAAKRAQTATLILQGQGNSPAVKKLATEVEALEDAISRRSAEFRVISQPVTSALVAAALPADAALVELAAYQPFNPHAKAGEDNYGAAHYAVYVLRPDGAISFADLGDAASLDADANKLRAALQTPKTAEMPLKDLARNLDERVMRPVRKLLGATQRVFLAPDGALNLIPFGALVDENGHYLLENYSFNYLTSGRDLLRLQVAGANELSAPSIVADPQFDLTKPVVTCRETQRGFGLRPADAPARAEYRGTDFTQFCYPTLAGTAQEAARLASLLTDAQVWTEQNATEAALKALRRPRILHIATHGFFFPDQGNCGMPNAECGAARGLGLNSLTPSVIKPQSENPLLRSGLILAGVNQRRSGPDNDGVLTALEAAGLDLFGTKLVVLSACETGLGEAPNGQGVYGLRRALVLAGSETQVMSLWQVSDEATRDLMGAYYQRLQAGEGRIEAMRQVQLAMLRGAGLATAQDGQRNIGLAPAAQPGGRQVGLGPDGKPLRQAGVGGPETPANAAWHHPYYWAAFIPSGAWTPVPQTPGPATP